MWLLVTWLLLGNSAAAQISPEAGAFYFRQYLPEGAHPQNWAAVQDPSGVMYFGNTQGILEYNGSRWRTIAVANGGAVRSLAIDQHGTVYVGGQGEIGYLKPDATGTLQYVSLLPQIPAADRQFRDVFHVYATRDGVMFGSPERIFRWGPDGVKVWRPVSSGTGFGLLFEVNGVAYVQELGLLRMSGSILEPVPGGEMFTGQNEVRGVFDFSGYLTVATHDGFYRTDGKKFTKWATEVDDLLHSLSVYAAVPLRNGDLAIGTERGGLLLMTPEGRLDRVIDRRSGIASNSVNGIFPDREGNVWLMLSKGIAHEEIELPITRFGDREGLEEIVLTIERQGDTLYAGTMTGLNRLVLSHLEGPHFSPVPGIQGQVFALLSTRNGLLAGTRRGIFEVRGDSAELILPGPLIYDLSRSVYDQNLLYAVGRKGLYVLRLDGGRWRKVQEVPPDGLDFRSVLEDPDGSLWMTTTGPVLRVTLGSGSAKVERFTEKDGVGQSWHNQVFRCGTKILFATPGGLRQFDRDRQRFVPYQGYGTMFGNGTRSVSRVAESSSGDVWLSGEGYNGVLHHRSSGGYIWDESPLARSNIKEIYTLYLDPNDVAWAAGSDGGLVRSNVWSTTVPVSPFEAHIQTLRLDRGRQVLFGGNGLMQSPPRISHSRNALRFQLFAPAFDDESRTKYQVRLDDLDHGWSEWSDETRKEYTNLWEGSYVFHVRARDLYGRISSEGRFSFSVLPPWFRTWWAYSLYAFVLVLFMWAVVRWRLHVLAEANRRLELVIEERTEEIRQQRDTIKNDEAKTRALLLNILPASVAEELSTTGSVTPLGYDDITVCFTDFVGFTVSTEGLPPSDLVTALHKYFTAFDEIVGRYGLEKLKTIGDSYMFVSGLPNRTSSHAVDAVMAALEIVEFVTGMAEMQPSWKIRVGIHSGPVIAGVVGVRKFAFDIWGETVNFASRFESSGFPNRVNISAKTFELVRDFIDCEPRGPVSIKEGRKLEMYFARSIRPELLDGVTDWRRSPFAQRYRETFGRLPRTSPASKPAELFSQSAAGS